LKKGICCKANFSPSNDLKKLIIRIGKGIQHGEKKKKQRDGKHKNNKLSSVKEKKRVDHI